MSGILKAVVGGVLILALLVAFGAADAEGVRVLYAFKAGNDGWAAASGLIADGSGNLYGTTEDGGGSGCGGVGYGCGTVYRLAPDGTESVLYAFQGGNDGWIPIAGLTADTSGNLYGTTLAGGGSGCGGYGCGIVFKVAQDGMESILYAFTGGSDGGLPWAGLVQDKAGNLYGTTSVYGAGNLGAVFRLAPDGTLTVLHDFTGGSDGGQNDAGLILDRAGNLYGTTATGGNRQLCGGAGCGVVFKVAPDGTESVLYTFSGGLDGSQPTASLLLDKAGNLFGTATAGGQYGYGVAFKLAPDGTQTVLHAFGGTLDGQNPEAGLISDGAGNLYGTTPFGGLICGKFQCGVVFRIAPGGKEKVLYRFRGASDGCGPGSGDVLILRKAALYGTTSGCGANGYGTVFRIRK